MNSILATLTALAVSTSLATSVLADQASLLHSKKIIEALAFTGQPLDAEQVAALTSAQSSDEIAAVLDPLLPGGGADQS